MNMKIRADQLKAAIALRNDDGGYLEESEDEALQRL